MTRDLDKWCRWSWIDWTARWLSSAKGDAVCQYTRRCSLAFLSSCSLPQFFPVDDNVAFLPFCHQKLGFFIPAKKMHEKAMLPHQSATDTCLNTKTWKDERDILKPRNLRYQKWPYYKGIHLFQTIILGIHPLVFGDVSALNAITCLPRHTVQELRDVRNTWHENNDFWWCTCSPGLSPWICE